MYMYDIIFVNLLILSHVPVEWFTGRGVIPHHGWAKQTSGPNTCNKKKRAEMSEVFKCSI